MAIHTVAAVAGSLAGCVYGRNEDNEANIFADNVRVISHTEGFNIVDFLNGISKK